MYTLVFLVFITMLSTLVGTLAGFGTSTIMIPLLSLLFPAPATLFFVGIIHWFGNLWKIIFFHKGFRLMLIALFAVPGLIFTFIGAHLVFSISDIALKQLLGFFLIGYVILQYIRPALKLPQKPATALIGGTLYGFSSGFFGIGGGLRGVFLDAFRLPKEVYLATTGFIGIVVDTVRIGTYATQSDTFHTYLLWALPLAIPVSFIGAYAGQRMVNVVPYSTFRTIVICMILIIGIKLVFS